MPQRRAQPATRTQPAQEEAPPLASTPLRGVDHSGRRRRGVAGPHRAGRQPDISFPAEDLELLRKASLYSRASLRVAPEEVFTGDKPLLTLLARDLLLSTGAADYLNAIAVALSAPRAANPATLERLGGG